MYLLPISYGGFSKFIERHLKKKKLRETAIFIRHYSMGKALAKRDTCIMHDDKFKYNPTVITVNIASEKGKIHHISSVMT